MIEPKDVLGTFCHFCGGTMDISHGNENLYTIYCSNYKASKNSIIPFKHQNLMFFKNESYRFLFTKSIEIIHDSIVGRHRQYTYRLLRYGLAGNITDVSEYLFYSVEIATISNIDGNIITSYSDHGSYDGDIKRTYLEFPCNSFTIPVVNNKFDVDYLSKKVDKLIILM